MQTIKPERMTLSGGKCFFQIRMGLNYTNDDHVYQLVVKANKDRNVFAQSDVVVSTKEKDSRLSFEAVVKLLP